MKTIRTAVFAIIAMGMALPASGQLPPGTVGPFEPNPEADAAIDQLWSPFCPGLMLDVCPSPQAGIYRDSLQVLAAEGMASVELVDWFIGRFGEQYRAVPRAEGTGLLAWLAPPLALLLGIGLTGVVLRRITSRRSEEEMDLPPQELSEQDQERVEAALRALEDSEEPVF